MALLGSSSAHSLSSINLETESTTTSSSSKRAVREGGVQLTSLASLTSHTRFFFLYNDTLIISKQKGPNQFKLKEKLPLSRVWVASSQTSDSFLIGWPAAGNYLVHFRSRSDKEEWFALFSSLCAAQLKPLATMIAMQVDVKDRHQTIRRRVDNGRKSAELVSETASELGLPPASYELRFIGGEREQTMQGPENVYCVVMAWLEGSGVRLSDSQKSALDTCPLANVRLLLTPSKTTKPTPKQIVNSIRKRVLSRPSPKCALFGRSLAGPTPPQPILTIVDHLRMNACDIEGIFRKSPKQSTFKELRCELEKGETVPDFGKYSAHVLASLLKDYLRSIPGRLLQSGNYSLWMREVVEEEREERRIAACSSLLALLPTAHLILLSNVLKLLAKVAATPASKMTAASLSVCLAPSFLEGTDAMEGGKKIPLLVEFLIKHAAEVVPGYSSDNYFSLLHPADLNQNTIGTEEEGEKSEEQSEHSLVIEEFIDDAVEELPFDEEGPSKVAKKDVLNDDRLDTIDESGEAESDVEFRAPSILDFSTDTDSEWEDNTTLRSRGSLAEMLKATFKEPARLQPVSTPSRTVPPPAETKHDTPRSPCLKRIHFQKTEERHRNERNERIERNELAASVATAAHAKVAEVPASPRLHRSLFQPSDPLPSALSQLGRSQAVNQQRFPAYKSKNVAEVPASPRLQRAAAAPPVFPPLCKPPAPPVSAPFSHAPSYRRANDDVQKPTVQVPPFHQTPPAPVSAPPSLPPPAAVVVHSPLMERVSRPDFMMCKTDSPRFTRKFSQQEKTSSTAPPPLPPSLPQHDYTPALQRSSSQRAANAAQMKKEAVQRAASVREREWARALGRQAERGEGCVGMDPVEINWSVRHLKTLFQDSRAPAIRTDYDYGN